MNIINSIETVYHNTYFVSNQKLFRTLNTFYSDKIEKRCSKSDIESIDETYLLILLQSF